MALQQCQDISGFGIEIRNRDSKSGFGIGIQGLGSGLIRGSQNIYSTSCNCTSVKKGTSEKKEDQRPKTLHRSARGNERSQKSTPLDHALIRCYMHEHVSFPSPESESR